MTSSTIADGERQLPKLRPTEVSSQLIVKGKPFLMLAAELHNSTFSKSAYMERVWPAMKEMNINTLLGAVTWETIEPEEGQFSFEELDKCILGARKHGFHIVILWFGAYKNARSTYAPAWVKKDVKRFPRIHTRQPDGKLKTVEVVQPYGKEIQQVSLRAFTKLMGHLRDFDADHSTVIMVQIENEIGLLFDSRDRSRLANQLYEQPVPTDLLDHLKKNFDSLHPMFKKKYPSVKGLSAESPTWEQAFGPSPLTEDLFMADAFSRFVAPIAVAGRAEYDIPLYMNAALCSEEPDWKDFSGEIPEGTPEGNEPGQYPSGGPVGHNLDVYRFNAPGVDFYAPDIYLQDYEKICECFRHEGQPLFIPEQRRDEYGARRVWVAYGTYPLAGGGPTSMALLLLDIGKK